MVFEEGTETILEHMLCGSDYVEEVQIPQGVTTIEYAAFAEMPLLKEITIPVGVTYIGRYTFNADTGLEKVVWNEGIETLDSNIFSGDKALKLVALGDRQEEGTIIFPSTLKKAGTNNFADSTLLTKVIFADAPAKEDGTAGTSMVPTNAIRPISLR